MPTYPAIIFVKNKYKNIDISVTRVHGTGNVSDVEKDTTKRFEINPDSTNNKVTIKFAKKNGQPITHDDPIVCKSNDIFQITKSNQTNWVLSVGYFNSNIQSDVPNSTTDDPSTTNVDIGTPQ